MAISLTPDSHDAAVEPKQKKGLKWVFGVEGDGLRVAVRARSATNAKEVFKSSGAWWSMNIKAWMFTVEGAKAFADRLSKNKGLIDTELDTSNAHKFIYWGISNNYKPGAFSSLLDVRLFNINNKGTVLLTTSYDRIIAKNLTRAMGGYWDSDHDAYVFRGKTVQEMLKALADVCYVYPDEVYVNKNVFKVLDVKAWRDVPRPRLTFGAETALKPEDFYNPAEDDAELPEEKKRKLLELAMAPIEKRPIDLNAVAVASERFSLREYQTAGVIHQLESTSTLLADDMGLGKTRQSIVAAFLRRKEGVNLAVVPAYLRINWLREIRGLKSDEDVWIYGVNSICDRKQDQAPYLLGKKKPDWIISSYESMDLAAQIMLKHGWSIDSFIVDEAHYLKDLSSQRTQKGFAIAQSASSCTLLTGTPTLSNISEIYTLMKLSGHPLTALDYLTFEKTFGRSKMDRRVLNSKLQSWMLRRSKSKELNLKGKVRQEYMVDGCASFWKKYKEIESATDMVMLTKILRAREIMEQEKIGAAFSLIEGMGNDDKVILFVNFKETFHYAKTRAKMSGIGVVGFCGDDSVNARQKAVDQFQQDPETKLIVLTMDAGYAGWTLTKANWVLFTSMPWTPSKLLQAEDRAYRLGQERLVNVGVITINGTVDQPLWASLQYKANIAADVLEPDELYEAEKEQALEMVKAHGFRYRAPINTVQTARPSSTDRCPV